MLAIRVVAGKRASALTTAIALALLGTDAVSGDGTVRSTPVPCVPYESASPCFSPLRLGEAVSFVETPPVAGSVAANVALAWDAPDDGEPASYIVEAGSAPGLSDVAIVETRGGERTLHVVGVPPGVYFVRVKARTAGGVSDASNEVVVTVGGASIAGPSTCSPTPPTAVTSSVSGTVVTLRWIGSPGATSYQIEAGTSPGASNLYIGDIGDLSALQAQVAPGTYFVRVRARSTCGTSAPSQEVVIRVTR